MDELKVAHIENASTFRIRVIEEPLTPHNLTSIISAITHLSTKCWLIANKRFADLIEYTQTNDVRFVEEAQLIITRMSHNSPLDASFKIDLSASNVAEAITTAIDGVVHIPKRLEKAELENKTQAINYAFEIALKSVTVLHPNTDEQTRSMLIQTMLPTILQLQNGKGLELVLPAPHSSEEKKEGLENS